MTTHYETRRPGPYRSRDGMVFGVCKGFADYLNFSVFWMRIIALVFLFVSFGWALMKTEPVLPLESEADEEFYNSFASSRRMALHRLKRTFDSLNRRIERMEGIVTAREYDWDRRLNE